MKMLKPKSASAYLGLHNGVSDDFVAVLDRLRDQDGVIPDLLPHLYKFAMEGQTPRAISVLFHTG